MNIYSFFTKDIFIYICTSSLIRAEKQQQQQQQQQKWINICLNITWIFRWSRKERNNMYI